MSLQLRNLTNDERQALHSRLKKSCDLGHAYLKTRIEKAERMKRSSAILLKDEVESLGLFEVTCFFDTSPPDDTIRVMASFIRKNSFWSHVMPTVMDNLVTKPK